MLFLIFQLLFGLLLHGPLCGRATSVAGTDTQVPWYDTRGSDVTDTSPPPCLHLPAKSSKFQFDNARRRGSRERFNRPSSWRGEPLLGHSGCRSTTWCLVCTDPYSCFHMGHCVDEPLVSQLQTRKWLGRTHIALTSQTGPESLRWIFPRLTLYLHSFLAVPWAMWTLLLLWSSHRQVSQPLAGRATALPVSVAQPLMLPSCLKGSLKPNGVAVAGHWMGRVKAA